MSEAAHVYKVVEGSDAARFSSEVTALLQEGWQLYGPTQVLQPEKYPRYYQAMVAP